MNILHQRILVIVARLKVPYLRSRIFQRIGRTYSNKDKDRHVRDLINLGYLSVRVERPMPGTRVGRGPTLYGITAEGQVQADIIIERGVLRAPPTTKRAAG